MAIRDLIVIRHGEDNPNGLTPKGIEQMTYAAEKMKDIVGSRSVYLASSDKNRAIWSADIVKKVLGLNEKSKELGCLDIAILYEEFFDGIDLRKKEVGIIIAHKPFVEHLPDYMKRKYGYEVKGLREEVENGFGYHIDRANRLVRFFPED